MPSEDVYLDYNLDEDGFKKAVDRRNIAYKELEEIALKNLYAVASQYLEVYGKELGLSEMAEQLCTKIASDVDPQAWNRIIHRVKQISG